MKRLRRAQPQAPVAPTFGGIVDDTIRAVQPFTMTSPERVAALVDATEYVVRAGIAGDFVECGVWRGGSAMAAALTLKRLGDERPLWLFDTFDGMAAPTSSDVDHQGRSAEEILAADTTRAGNEWAVAPEDDVRANLRSTGYPDELLHFVRGRVEDTIPGQAPGSIALLRLDTDWYESTAHELEHLMPRLTSGGVLIIDDYGHWQGARRAVDEYLERTGLAVLLHRIDYTGRMAVVR